MHAYAACLQIRNGQVLAMSEYKDNLVPLLEALKSKTPSAPLEPALKGLRGQLHGLATSLVQQAKTGTLTVGITEALVGSLSHGLQSCFSAVMSLDEMVNVLKAGETVCKSAFAEADFRAASGLELVLAAASKFVAQLRKELKDHRWVVNTLA